MPERSKFYHFEYLRLLPHHRPLHLLLSSLARHLELKVIVPR
jgi:hypothetical protein